MKNEEMTNLEDDNIVEYSDDFFEKQFEECDEIIEIIENTNLNELENLVKTLKTEIEGMKGCKNKVDDLEIKNKFLEKEKLYLEEKLETLSKAEKVTKVNNSDLEEKDKKISYLLDKISKLEQINLSANRDSNILKNEKSNLLNEVEKIGEDVNTLTKLNANLINQIKDLKKNILQKEILNENLKVEKQILIEKKDKYISEIETLKLKGKFNISQLVERSAIIETIYKKTDGVFYKIILNESSVSDDIKKKMNQVIKNIIILRRFYAGVQCDIGHEKVCVDAIALLKEIAEESKVYNTNINEILIDFKDLKFEGENF